MVTRVEPSRLAVDGRQPYSAVRRQLFILGLFPLGEAIAWTTIFPYIYSMVQSFSPESDSDDKNTAIYAGVMVSVFTFGEFLMAPQWARISDKIGRKPTLIIGSGGGIFAALAFGFSSSLPMAIGARLAAGILNPNLGIVQTFIGEMVSKENQAKGFSLVPFFRVFGTIIGPVIGGYLAEPVKKYPLLFHENTIWDHYPYLLPNIISACFLLNSCIMGFLLLREVHPQFRDQMDLRSRFLTGAKNLISRRSWNFEDSQYVSVASDEDTELGDIGEASTSGPGTPDEKPQTTYTKQVMLQILSFAISGFLKITTLVMIPVFLATPPHAVSTSPEVSVLPYIPTIRGGFGLDTNSISNVLLSQAIVAIMSQLWFVPKIVEMQGALRSFRVVNIVLLCVYCAMPFTVLFPSWLALPTMLVCVWAYALINGLGTTCSSILITNTAPSPVLLATINGMAASLGCLARTMGPIVSGPLFRLGLEIGSIGLPFWTLGGVATAGIIVSYFMRDHP